MVVSLVVPFRTSRSPLGRSTTRVLYTRPRPQRVWFLTARLTIALDTSPCTWNSRCRVSEGGREGGREKEREEGEREGSDVRLCVMRTTYKDGMLRGV